MTPIVLTVQSEWLPKIAKLATKTLIELPLGLTDKKVLPWLISQINANQLQVFCLTTRGSLCSFVLLSTKGLPPYEHYAPQILLAWHANNYVREGKPLIDHVLSNTEALGFPEIYWLTTTPFPEDRHSTWLPLYPHVYGEKRRFNLYGYQHFSLIKPMLKTERMYIRCLHTQDFEQVAALQSNINVMRFLDGVRDRENVKQRIIEWRAHYIRNKFAFSGLFNRENDEFMGCSGLFHLRMDETQPEIEMGYTLGEAYWGKGYATEIATALRDYGFNQLKINRIWATTRPTHTASQKVLEKIGFHYSHTATHQGSLAHFYGITKDGSPLPSKI